MSVAIVLSAVLAATAGGTEGAWSPASAPPPQDVLFFNARIALREGRNQDVLRLWLLHNAVQHQGVGPALVPVGAGAYDDDFRSLVWAALGNLGDCPDGFPEDEVDVDAAPGEPAGGAGLWLLAEHNLLLHGLRTGPPADPAAPWDAFRVGRQRRAISLHDVLSKEELKNASFTRTSCLQPYFAYARFPQLAWPDLKDRLVVGTMMKRLLERARATLSKKKVASTALIEARLFDLSLTLAKLEAQRATQRGGQAAQLARSVGLPEGVAAEVAQEVGRVPGASEHREFLLRALSWRPREWLDLSRDRRVALFAQARATLTPGEQTSLDPLVVGIIDELIARQQGAEVETFIGLASQGEQTTASLIGGERGLRLLALDPGTGFRRRGVIALHRGVRFLEQGERDQALRSFAFAVGHASEAKDGDVVHDLALRWLTYVLAQYESTAELVATLQELVPRADYNKVIEELVWRAALRADAASFDRLASTVRKGGSLDARIEDLRPLARGDAGALVDAQRAKAVEEPTAVLAFLTALVGKLESESADVRHAHTSTLRLIAGVARDIVAADASDTAGRRATQLMNRIDALLEGLGALGLAGADARAMSPSHEAFAGAVRLAPSDELPWPFLVPQADAPSAFLPVVLKPEEWRQPDGTLVFGWRLTE